MTAPSDFGLWLRTRRQACDLTRDELAELINYASGTVRNLERGLRRPSKHLLQCLFEALAIEPAERALITQLVRHGSPLDAADDPATSAADAPSSFAPATLPALPPVRTQLIGRAEECAFLGDLLQRAHVQLVTITGSAGVGKTTLALHVAHELALMFADGVCFIPLASITDPELVMPTLANHLGCRATSREAQITLLIQYVQTRHMLLVLDTFEHLLPASGDLLRLLDAAPHLRVLITSRERLRLSAEYVLDVAPLGYPNPQALPTLEKLAEIPAVALLISRIQAVQPRFQMTQATATSIAALCQQLDGLPLALELAAARCSQLPPEVVLSQWAEWSGLLADGPRDWPIHQRSLSATLDWSYSLLSADEQWLLLELGIFADSFTLAALDAVCCVPTRHAALLRLLDLHLIVYDHGTPHQPRFRLLNTIREYVVQRTPRQDAQLQQRYFDYYYHLAAQRANPATDHVWWLETVALEIAHLRAALHWMLRFDLEQMARLALALHWFWLVRGPLHEAQYWMECLAQHADQLSPEMRAAVWHHLGNVLYIQGKTSEAKRIYAISLDAYTHLAHHHGAGGVLNNLGIIASAAGDYAEAQRYFEASLVSYQAAGVDEGAPLTNLGKLMTTQGEYARAFEYFQATLRLYRGSQNIGALTNCLVNIAWTFYHQGAYEQALHSFLECIPLIQTQMNRTEGCRLLVGLSMLAAQTGQATQALHLCGAAEATSESLGTAFITLFSPHESAHISEMIAQTRHLLDRQTAQQVWEAGRSMTMQETITSLTEQLPFASLRMAHHTPLAPLPGFPALMQRAAT